MYFRLVIARMLLNDNLPFLRPTDTVEMALGLLQEFHTESLALVDGSVFKGMISEDFLLDQSDEEAIMADLKAPVQLMRSHPDNHIFEVTAMMVEHQMRVIPVVDEDNEYLGLIDTESILQFLGGFAVFTEPGAVLMLDMPSRDYSLAELARIVESNDAHVLSVWVRNKPGEGKIEVVLKVNRQDASGIISTLERYEYQVIGSFSRQDYYDDLKERFDSFMRYLNT